MYRSLHEFHSMCTHREILIFHIIRSHSNREICTIWRSYTFSTISFIQRHFAIFRTSELVDFCPRFSQKNDRKSLLLLAQIISSTISPNIYVKLI